MNATIIYEPSQRKKKKQASKFSCPHQHHYHHCHQHQHHQQQTMNTATDYQQKLIVFCSWQFLMNTFAILIVNGYSTYSGFKPVDMKLQKKRGGKQRRPTGQLTFIYSSNWPKIRKKKKSKAKPLFFWLNNAKIQCKYFLRLSEKQFVDAAINRRYILRIREQKTRRSRQLLRRKEKGK